MSNNDWTTEEFDQELCYQIEDMWFVQEELEVLKAQKARKARKARKAQKAPQAQQEPLPPHDEKEWRKNYEMWARQVQYAPQTYQAHQAPYAKLDSICEGRLGEYDETEPDADAQKTVDIKNN